MRTVCLLLLALVALVADSHYIMHACTLEGTSPATQYLRCAVSGGYECIGETGARIPCPPPPPTDAEVIARRTRNVVAAYEREEADKAAAYYSENILPLIEAHLAALPDRLRSGNLDGLAARELTVAWPVGTSKPMRNAVMDLLQKQGFITLANENLLLVKWPH